VVVLDVTGPGSCREKTMVDMRSSLSADLVVTNTDWVWSQTPPV
jgi:hypothetical protein